MKNFKSHRILPHIKNNRFYNSPDDVPESFVFQTLPLFLRSLRNRKSRFPQDQSEKWVCKIIPAERSQELCITWIGHASFLIQVNGINILTDPIFTHASILFPRVLPPGIEPQALPPIDAVLLSHNHPDHTDFPSLKMIPGYQNIDYFVPQGDKHWLEKKGLSHVYEFMWWNRHELRVGETSVMLTFLPARHWSRCGLLDRNKSLWGSWMIQAGEHTIYFAGDTAYSNHFDAILKEFPSITTAMMPIAPCSPEKSMEKTHMNARQAVQAFVDLRARYFIPMHWGTFAFGTDCFYGPLDLLERSWKEHAGIENQTLSLVKVGQPLSIPL